MYVYKHTAKWTFIDYYQLTVTPLSLSLSSVLQDSYYQLKELCQKNH